MKTKRGGKDKEIAHEIEEACAELASARKLCSDGIGGNLEAVVGARALVVGAGYLLDKLTQKLGGGGVVGSYDAWNRR